MMARFPATLGDAAALAGQSLLVKLERAREYRESLDRMLAKAATIRPVPRVLFP